MNRHLPNRLKSTERFNEPWPSKDHTTAGQRILKKGHAQKPKCSSKNVEHRIQPELIAIIKGLAPGEKLETGTRFTEKELTIDRKCGNVTYQFGSVIRTQNSGVDSPELATLAEVAFKGGVVLLSGPSGAGKTTIATKMLSQWFKSSPLRLSVLQVDSNAITDIFNNAVYRSVDGAMSDLAQKDMDLEGFEKFCEDYKAKNTKKTTNNDSSSRCHTTYIVTPATAPPFSSGNSFGKVYVVDLCGEEFRGSASDLKETLKINYQLADVRGVVCGLKHGNAFPTTLIGKLVKHIISSLTGNQQQKLYYVVALSEATSCPIALLHCNTARHCLEMKVTHKRAPQCQLTFGAPTGRIAEEKITQCSAFTARGAKIPSRSKASRNLHKYLMGDSQANIARNAAENLPAVQKRAPSASQDKGRSEQITRTASTSHQRTPSLPNKNDSGSLSYHTPPSEPKTQTCRSKVGDRENINTKTLSPISEVTTFQRDERQTISDGESGVPAEIARSDSAARDETFNNVVPASSTAFKVSRLEERNFMEISDKELKVVVSNTTSGHKSSSTTDKEIPDNSQKLPSSDEEAKYSGASITRKSNVENGCPLKKTQQNSQVGSEKENTVTYQAGLFNGDNEDRTFSRRDERPVLQSTKNCDAEAPPPEGTEIQSSVLSQEKALSNEANALGPEALRIKSPLACHATPPLEVPHGEKNRIKRSGVSVVKSLKVLGEVLVIGAGTLATSIIILII